jgi:nanoRNase/pAp phosphatase (c-di-AMP/oligoRNAs hydrolase)
MALPELQQATKLVKGAGRILLTVADQTSEDAVAAMVATYLALQSTKEKGVDEVSSSHVPQSLQFLAGSSQVQTTANVQPEITVDIAGPITIDAVRTVPLQGGVRLHISLPDKTVITKDNIETSVRAMPYELIITFGTSDLEALGSLFFDHTDFFYNTPIINIDHRANNEHYGTVNLVDITAGSVAEVTWELINILTGDKLDEAIATALYAGVVAGTGSFQKPSTTPRSFLVAARLMEANANREEVIQHLIKTKPLSLLKLAGRLYARLRFHRELNLFWSIVRQSDFTDSGSDQKELSAAIDELSNNLAGFNVAFVLQETAEKTYFAWLLLGKGLHQRREEIQQQLSARRENGLLRITLNAPTLEEAENVALEQIAAIVR